MKDKIFYAICFGFLAGVFLRSFLVINFPTVLFICILSFAFILIYSLIVKNNWGIVVGIFILAFSFGILIFNFSDKIPSLPADVVSGKIIQIEEKGNFSGQVLDDPEIKEKNQKLIVSLAGQKSKALLTVGLEERYQYGDILNFSGKLEKPENFTTDQGKEFDYINYLRKDGIFYLINYPEIKIVAHDNGNIVKSSLFSLKNKFLQKINSSLPEPGSLLMGGLILGERSAFDNDFRQNFINTGTIHIVALSGYNITIVAEWIMKVFTVLLAPLSFNSVGHQNLGIGVGILAIFLFILMTGTNSTAIRAGVMATLALVARATGRNYDVFRALFLAGIVMILFNPLLLVYDVSFQLSFLATIAVIFLAPRIEKYFVWIPKKFKLRDIISVTCAAYIFVFPFILYQMGNLSLTALPANALILPFIPATMLFGFLTGITGLIYFPLSAPFAFIAKILLSYELGVINFLANLPFSSFSIPNFPLIITIAIYIYFIYRLFSREIKKFFISPS